MCRTRIHQDPATGRKCKTLQPPAITAAWQEFINLSSRPVLKPSVATFWPDRSMQRYFSRYIWVVARPKTAGWVVQVASFIVKVSSIPFFDGTPRRLWFA